MYRASTWLVLLAACGTTPPGRAPTPDALTATNGALVARLVHAAYDPTAHAATSKPWHQVFDATGKQLTKDLGGSHEHHRGVFLGWNRVRVGARQFDFWHCGNGETQRVRSVERQPGPGEAQVLRVDWCGKDGHPVLHEERRLAVQSLPDANVLHFTTELRAADDDVALGGDPHHAGCHFRAVQAFAEAGATPVRFVRPPTARASRDDLWADCRWTAAVLPFADGDVTVLRVEHPDNPNASWSTRGYGRFGATWSATATRERPVRLAVAYVVATGAREATWCEATAKVVFER